MTKNYYSFKYSGSMIRNLFLKNEGENKWIVQTFALTP
jgi:hypothetical protein